MVIFYTSAVSVDLTADIIVFLVDRENRNLAFYFPYVSVISSTPLSVHCFLEQLEPSGAYGISKIWIDQANVKQNRAVH